MKIVALGLMSGTSVDGLDIALCEFIKNDNKWTFEVIKTKAVEYDTNMQGLLLNASQLNPDDLKLADAEFAMFSAKEIADFIKDVDIKIDLIASHGHTVFHRPEELYTLQIGDGEIIANECGLIVVSDFRTKDVALGGQGAPLVPIGDWHLFPEFSACLNLGGFSNVSFDANNGDRLAYDISPVNIVLNEIVRKLGKDYDDKGSLAKSGKIIPELFENLNSLDYYKKNLPKSLSREWVDEIFMPIVNQYEAYEIVDVLNTLVLHFAQIIADELKSHVSVLVTGGGAYNDFLIEQIQEKSKAELVIPNKQLIEFKEAIIFAFLGTLRFLGENNVLSSVTGATQDSCSGVINYPSE